MPRRRRPLRSTTLAVERLESKAVPSSALFNWPGTAPGDRAAAVAMTMVDAAAPRTEPRATAFAPGRLTTLARGLGWGEGPAFDAQHRLYFTDLKTGRILRWTAAGGNRGGLPGRLEVMLTRSGGANGLAFDAAGNLLACLGGARAVVRFSLSPGGQPAARTVLAAAHRGRGFTGPNDLWIDGRGGVYFTDTRYWNRTRSPQGGFHLYYLPPGQSEPVRATAGAILRGPNGVAGTPDGRLLYLADLPAATVWRYQVDPETGGLSNPGVFARQAVDGLEVDPATGDVYMATGHGVVIQRADGSRRGTIRVPGGAVNLAFGTGPHADTLFITTPRQVCAWPLDPARQA